MGNKRAVKVEWRGEGLLFEGGGVEPPTPAVLMDGDSAEAPSPVQMLLLAAASCSAADVVLILEKMKQNLEGLSIGVEGLRRDDDPKRFLEIRFEFVARGQVAPDKMERAVNLSVEKYCSVVASLAEDMKVSYTARVSE